MPHPLTPLLKPQSIAFIGASPREKTPGNGILKAIRQGNYKDPDIFANDVVVVGTSEARRTFKDVLTAAPAFVTPLIYLIR